MARINEPTAEGVSLLMPYYNAILGARQAGGSRVDAWAAVQAGMEAGGADYQGASIFDMNYLWGRAGEVINAADVFDRLNPGDALPGNAFAWAPWTTPTTAAFANPEYLVRYEWLGTDPEGNQVSQFFQTDWSGSLDVTKQDVVDRLLGSAQLALDSYSSDRLSQLGLPEGTAITGIGQVQILRF